ncbi:MAG: phosphate acyltransferase, partial [Bacteroidales bacterium]|nr:phosphate acyltransferase [Bacteroidales bacterium]
MDLLNSIRQKAQADCQRIVLPEGDEERTILAADQIIREKLAHVILLGDPKEIAALVEKYGLNNIEKAQIIDPKAHAKKEEYAKLLFELRKAK